MSAIWTEAVRQQFGAAIDTLENAISACPEEIWFDPDRNPMVWYIASHAIFWLDFYMSDTPANAYVPPAPLGLEEMDPAGIIPARAFTKDELLKVLVHARTRVRYALDGLTEERAGQPYRHANYPLTHAELILYVMRHVQHHAAQINLVLRAATDSAPRWVGRAKSQ